MTRITVFVLCVSLLFAANDVPARDTIHKLSITDFLANPENASKLEGVSRHFGNQPHPEVIEFLGEHRTNKKTNAFNKSDEAACEWVMLSAMLSLHQRAQSIGTNAVINIKSNYKNNEESSDTDQEQTSQALDVPTED